ncbi:MAG: hypothetical protein V2G33_07215 [bacterium JZ-2024 1]
MNKLSAIASNKRLARTFFSPLLFYPFSPPLQKSPKRWRLRRMNPDQSPFNSLFQQG